MTSTHHSHVTCITGGRASDRGDRHLQPDVSRDRHRRRSRSSSSSSRGTDRAGASPPRAASSSSSSSAAAAAAAAAAAEPVRAMMWKAPEKAQVQALTSTQALNPTPKPQTPNPKPQTPNPKTRTVPQPWTLQCNLQAGGASLEEWRQSCNKQQ